MTVSWGAPRLIHSSATTVPIVSKAVWVEIDAVVDRVWIGS